MISHLLDAERALGASRERFAGSDAAAAGWANSISAPTLERIAFASFSRTFPGNSRTPLKRVASLAPFSRLSNPEEVIRVFAMQRLFSMFPTGGAGIALALLRITVAAMLLMIAFPRGEVISSQWAFAGLAVLAAFFFLGVFTPILCLVCCCIEIAAMFSLRGVDAMHMVLSIVDTAALGLLGPGGYSLDARMFGRRRVVLSTADSSDLN
jgi:hypothetical protein